MQGVGFRQFVYERARRLSLSGYVRNDRVDRQQLEVIAEGWAGDLRKFEDFLRVGPPGAKVTGFQSGWEPASGDFDHFQISY